MSEKLKFVAIEGGDGSGKKTQSKLLVDYLEEQGRPVLESSFPRYGKHSARTVEQYLRGEFGGVNEVAPELARAAYAIDRVAAMFDMNDFFEANPTGIIVSDRYVASNLAHQGTKIDDRKAREEFYADSLELEYGDLRLPKPDKNIVLLAPTDIAQQNVDTKATRSYTTATRDIHEADAGHLDKALRNYQEITDLYPEEFVAVWAIDKKTRLMRPIDDIQSEIREHIGVS